MKLRNQPRIRFRLSPLLIIAVLLSALLVSPPNPAQAQGPGLEVFGTGVGRLQTLTRTPAGDFYVVDGKAPGTPTRLRLCALLMQFACWVLKGM